MKQIFRSLTWAVATILIAWPSVELVARGQGTEDRGQGTGADLRPSTFDFRPSTPDPRPPSPPNAQRLIAQAAELVAAEPTISAELRYHVNAFGHQLVGTGRYLQLGSGSEKLLRMDLRMQVGDKPATIQEIRGSDFYWLRRDVPPALPTLGRVDLRELRRSLATRDDFQPDALLPHNGWIVLGGLPRMLSAIAENFSFTAAEAGELSFQSSDGKSISNLPIWTLTGRWKPERLAALADSTTGKGRVFAEQLPTQVELVLNRSEDVPLFPFRVTYLQSPPRRKTEGQPADASPRELLTLELFNVSRRDIDRREFQYQPGEQEVQELTPAYVQRFRDQPQLR